MFVHIRFIFLLANHHRGRRKGRKTPVIPKGEEELKPEEAVTEQSSLLVLKRACVKEVTRAQGDLAASSNKPAHSCQVPAKAVLCSILLAKDSQINSACCVVRELSGSGGLAA